MINNEYKQSYIKNRNEQKVFSEHFLKKTFEKAGEYEDEYGKDLCNFTKEQILDMYKSFNINSLEGLLNVNSQFSIYTRQCIADNMVIDGQNHYDEIGSDQIINCINKNLLNQKLITREQLLQWISTLNNSSDAFIIMSLFEGLGGKNYREITRLQIKDFDKEKSMVYTCGVDERNESRVLPVSQNLIGLAEETNETLIYRAEKRNYPLVENGRIIKDFAQTRATVDNEYHNGRKIYKRIKKILNQVTGSSTINGNDISVSGQMHCILERCNELKINPDQYIHDVNLRKEIEDRFATKINVTLYWKKYGEYLMSGY